MKTFLVDFATDEDKHSIPNPKQGYFKITDELIRCKDCKHWQSDADTGMACEFTNLSQPEDGFCNWAERRKYDE